MKRTLILLSCCALPMLAPSGWAQATHPQWGMVAQYCTECHNTDDWAGQLDLDSMTPASVAEHPEVFEQVLKKLSGRLMPPPGNPQPEQKSIDAFLGWVESTLDHNPNLPKAGHVPVQRMHRTEYASAVKDLIGVDIKSDEFLPTEIEVEGFDNMAAALSVSPAFMSQYIRAARLLAKQAVGDAQAKRSVVTYPASTESQTEYQAGMPPGTRGGLRFVHNFPADGDYQFNLVGLGGLNSSALETEHTLVLLIDGNQVFRGELGGPTDFELTERTGPAGSKQILDRFTNIPVTLTAGPHNVVVTFVERSRAQSLAWVDGGAHTRMPRLGGGVEVVGPLQSTGMALTPSRAKIFICTPQSSTEQASCARRITENLAQRAFGRKVTEADMNLLLPFYQHAAEQGGFDKGIEQVVAAVLSSPHFLYRSVVPAADQAEQPYFALDDLELASRLSFFLWSQRPDEELLQLAIANRLSEPKTLQAQVRRMLEDPRSAALVDNFAIKWLNLDNLEDVDPNTQLFPEYNDGLLRDLSEESRRFLSSVLLQDQPLLQLLTANHSYLNERLARHYGIDGVYGPQFRRVALSDEHRFGLLGKGAVMLRTSYGDRTSPVLRGNWVLERLLGTPSPPPPPNVVTDLTVPAGDKPTTLRARMEKHRNNPTCNQCHGVIDPIGLALENYSVTGRWRERDAQADEMIDAKTQMPGGIAISGPVDLRNELSKKPEKFVRTFTAKLLMYALGRELEYYDMPQVRAIVAGAAAKEYRLYDLVLGIVQSDAFRYQAQPSAASTVESTVESKAEPQTVATTATN